MVRTAVGIALLAIVLGCASAPSATTESQVERNRRMIRDCLQKPNASAYISLIAGRIIESWGPRNVEGHERARIRLRITGSGYPDNAKLVSASPKEYGEAAMRALENATPFPRPPWRASCLIGHEIEIKLKERNDA